MQSYTIRRFVPASIAAAFAVMTIAVSSSTMTTMPSERQPALHGSAPESLYPAADDETLGATSASYESATLHYRIHYPSTWSMDDKHQIAAIDTLKDPRGLFTVTIGNTVDPYVCMPQETERIRAAMERSAALDPTMMLWNAEIVTLNNHRAVATTSTRVVGNRGWKVRTFAVLRPEFKDTLNVFIAVRSDVETLFTPRMQEILNSLEVKGSGY